MHVYVCEHESTPQVADVGSPITGRKQGEVFDFPSAPPNPSKGLWPLSIFVLFYFESTYYTFLKKSASSRTLESYSSPPLNKEKGQRSVEGKILTYLIGGFELT